MRMTTGLLNFLNKHPGRLSQTELLWPWGGGGGISLNING